MQSLFIIFLTLISFGEINFDKYCAKKTVVDNNGFDKSTCTFKGKKLYGKIQYVTSFPDVKILIVDAFADIEVKKVDAFADDCGEWQEVTSFPDIKVQIVTAFPDVKVKYVNAFPGMR